MWVLFFILLGKQYIFSHGKETGQTGLPENKYREILILLVLGICTLLSEVE